jgi:hypothetical protein
MYDSSGELLFERLVERFLGTLYSRWVAAGATHSLSLILFSRTFYDLPLEELADLAGISLPDTDNAASNSRETPSAAATPKSALRSSERARSADVASWSSLADRALCVSPNGRLYEDIYVPLVQDLVLPLSSSSGSSAAVSLGGASATQLPSSVAPSPLSTAPTPGSTSAGSSSNSSLAEWHRVLRILKRAFTQFPRIAQWGSLERCRRSGRGPSGVGSVREREALPMQIGEGFPSLASQGNFLEAINLCLNTFSQHNVDRDLYRMGQVRM